EVVVPAPVRQPRVDEFGARVALRDRAPRERRLARGEPEPELAADLLAAAAPREVRARLRGSLGLPEVALVEAGGPLEQRVEALSVSALPVLLGRPLLVVELHVEAIGEPLDRADEVDPLVLLHERDRVASLAAAE